MSSANSDSVLFSIITVNFNDSVGLQNTIESVLRQSYGNFEFIVIDGGSTDGSEKILKDNSKGITFWCSEPDDGIYNAMNKGVKHAKGEYVLFLNAGDVFHSSSVLEEVACQLDDKDIVSGYALRDGDTVLNIHEKNILMMFFHSTFSHQATFIKKELFANYQYDESLRFVSDWKAWVDWVILGNKTYKYIDTIVADYDFNGISSDSSNWKKIVAERQQVLQDAFPPLVLYNLNLLHDIYMQTHYKYIVGHQKIKNICFALWKPMAFIGKLMSKNSLNE